MSIVRRISRTIFFVSFVAVNFSADLHAESLSPIHLTRFEGQLFINSDPFPEISYISTRLVKYDYPNQPDLFYSYTIQTAISEFQKDDTRGLNFWVHDIGSVSSNNSSLEEKFKESLDNVDGLLIRALLDSNNTIIDRQVFKNDRPYIFLDKEKEQLWNAQVDLISKTYTWLRDKTIIYGMNIHFEAYDSVAFAGGVSGTESDCTVSGQGIYKGRNVVGLECEVELMGLSSEISRKMQITSAKSFMLVDISFGISLYTKSVLEFIGKGSFKGTHGKMEDSAKEISFKQ